MKRYYVFVYTTYYPLGGMTDCKLFTNNRKKAIAKAVFERDENFNHASVWDVKKGKFIELPEED